MPINEFDKSERPQYVSNRIQLPFEELNAIAKNQQKSFDEGKAIEDDLGALGNAIQAAPMHQQDRLNLINKYKGKINELSGSGNVNYADPAFKRKAANLVNEFKNDPNYQSLKGTLEAYKIYEKRKVEKGAERDLDFTYEKNLDGSFKQVSSLEKGIYSSKFTQFEDYNEAGKKVMGKVADDSTTKEMGLDLGNTRINNGETEVWSRKTGKYEGVTGTKLSNLSKRMVGEYASTNAGKHHLQSLLGQNIDYQELNNLANSGNEQAIKTKTSIDKEFANHLYNSNANQIGVKTETTYDDQFITNRATQKANDAKEEEPKPPAIPLNSGVPNLNPDPNKLQTDFKNTNPNSSFSFNKNGTMNHVKVGDTGSKFYNTYKDKNGKVWDTESPPTGWKFYENEASFKKDHPNEYWDDKYHSNGAFRSSGGNLLNTNDLQDKKQKRVPNTETLNKQMTEVLSWGAITGQTIGKDGLKSYNELLPKYESAMRNGVLNSQYLPAAGKGLQDAFSAMYFPEVNSNGEVTKAGNTSGWIIDGKQATPTDLAGAKFKLFDVNSGKGDNVIITGKDGMDHTVEMNDPTLKDNIGRLTTFNKANHNLILNPIANKLSPLEEKTRKTHILDGIGNEFFNYAQQQAGGVLSDDQIQYVKMGLTNLKEDLDVESKKLTKTGYSYGENYTDPKTKLIATSYINHKTGDVQVVVLDLQNNKIETIPSDQFGNRIVQSTIGNWNANINDMSKETGVNYNNQEGK